MNQDSINAAAHTSSPEQDYIAELQRLVDPLHRIVSIHITTEDDEARARDRVFNIKCSEGDLIVTLKIHPQNESPTTWEENWGDPENPDPYYAYRYEKTQRKDV